MKNTARSIIPLTALAVLLIAISPMASASTLTVNLNPKTGLAKVDSVSTTTIVFTYPAGSTVSNYFKNVSSTLNLKGSFEGSADGAKELQSSFDAGHSHVTVHNLTAAFDYSAKGNATTFVVNKMTNITAWVSGVFSVVNGSVRADLGWRSYVIRGALSFPFEDHSMDINLVGSSMQASLGSHEIAAGLLFTMFGAGSLWNRPTLNFSALSTPLSTWTKNYDASTNTTTFSKTISGQSKFTASIDYNGQSYSLSAISDPSGVVSVQGYANASGDSLVIAPTPASMTANYLTAAAVVVVLVIAAGYLALRSRAKAKASIPASSFSV
jgi:hypothetical protein